MVDDNVTHASKLTSFVNKHLRKGPSEPFFDDIVDLAIQLYRAPMAVVAFANETGYWFKAQRGLHIQAIDNTAHLLARTLGADAPLVVANNMRDDAAATDPLLIAVGARFFVGVPLVAVDGVPIGALAVMDRIARCGSTEDEHGGLTILARRVVGEVEQRYRSADQESKHEERFRFIADNVQDLIAVLDTSGIRLYNNPAYRELLGDPERLRGTYAFEQIHQEDRTRMREIFDRTVKSGKGEGAEFRFVLVDQSIRHMESQGIPILDSAGKVKEVIFVTHDVTKYKLRVEDQQRSHRELLTLNAQMAELNKMADYLHRCDSIGDIKKIILQHESSLFGACAGAIYRFDAQLAHFEVFQSWGEETPVASYFSMNDCWAVKNDSGFHVVEDADPGKGLCCKHVAELKSPYLCVRTTGKGNCNVVLHLQLSGLGEFVNREEQRLRINAKRDLATAFAQQVAVAIENLGRREELEAAALTDALTGLYGRRFVQEELWKKVAIVKRNQTSLGVIAVDIDHFKRINDTYEHEGGDYVLRGVAKFLQDQLRESDYACRTGGEEFMLILTNPIDEDSVLAVAEKVREGAKALVLHFEGKPIKVTLSLGVTFVSGKALQSYKTTSEFAREKAAQLTRVADAALYQAKQEGRDKVVFRDGTEEHSSSQ